MAPPNTPVGQARPGQPVCEPMASPGCTEAVAGPPGRAGAMPPRRPAALALLSGAAALLLSACAALPIDPPISGHTCCNLRLEHGWISSNNVQGGTVIPAGEPVRLQSIKKQFYVYGTLGSAEVAFRDDNARNEHETLDWLRQVVVSQDPRIEFNSWPAEVRQAVRAAKVMPGMTRAQVRMALGPPSRSDTPDPKAKVWRYWTALEDLPVDLLFGDDGRLASLSGRPSAVRLLEQER